MKNILTAALICLGAAALAATWPMTETTGQKLAVHGGKADPGYLGIAPASDELDAEMTGPEGVICNGKTTVTIPAGPALVFDKAAGFTMSVEVKFLEELDAVDTGHSRYQIISRGYDSHKESWQLRLIRKKNFSPYFLEFFMLVPTDGKKWFSCKGPVTILPQTWYRFTVAMDRKTCRLYLNGKEIGAKPCSRLPPTSKAPILLGIYANGKTMGFPMQIRNFAIEKNAILPDAPSSK